MLLLANSDEIEGKLAAGNGRIAKLVKENKPIRDLIEELYLATCSRFPTSEELQTTVHYLDGQPNKQQGLEDVLWTLMNSKEFSFNH